MGGAEQEWKHAEHDCTECTVTEASTSTSEHQLATSGGIGGPGPLGDATLGTSVFTTSISSTTGPDGDATNGELADSATRTANIWDYQPLNTWEFDPHGDLNGQSGGDAI